MKIRYTIYAVRCMATTQETVLITRTRSKKAAMVMLNAVTLNGFIFYVEETKNGSTRLVTSCAQL